MIWMCAMAWWATAAASVPDVGPTLEHEELLAMLPHHPALRAVASARRAAEVGVASAAPRPVPTLSVSAAPWTMASDATDPGVTVSLGQRWAPPGAVARARRVAALGEEVIAAEGVRVWDDLVRDASLLYVERWLAGRVLAVRLRHDVLLEDLSGRTQRRYEAGGGLRGDVLAVEVLRAANDDRRLDGQARVAALDAELRALVGDDTWDVPPPGDLPGARAEGAAGRASELLVADAAHAMAEAGVPAAKASRGPRVGWMTQYSSMWSMPSHRWMVGGSVELPLSSRADRSRVASAEVGVDAATAQRAAAERRVRAQTDAAKVAVEAAVARRALARGRGREVARDRLEAVTESYEAGLVDVDALLRAAAAAVDAELAVAEAEARVAVAEIVLAHAEGRR